MSTRPRTRLSEPGVRNAIEAAVWAPSIHNSQPWWFGTRETAAGPAISLHADVDRRLEIVDPDGREMLISCGAALGTLRIALRHYGCEPEVQVLPDADKPHLLADIGFGEPAEESPENRRLYDEIRRRRSHRGVFRDLPVAAYVQAQLTAEAAREGAQLRVVIAHPRIALAALTEAAEQVHRINPLAVREMARWAPRPDSMRPEGVHHTAYPSQPGHSEPHFPTRDFGRGQGWGVPAAAPATGITGLVAVLVTRGDTRGDWLAAGQALQRTLLRASAEGLSAAFHTQALEVPEFREFIRTHLCAGGYPQVIMRLGTPPAESASVRRPIHHVVKEES